MNSHDTSRDVFQVTKVSILFLALPLNGSIIALLIRRGIDQAHKMLCFILSLTVLLESLFSTLAFFSDVPVFTNLEHMMMIESWMLVALIGVSRFNAIYRPRVYRKFYLRKFIVLQFLAARLLAILLTIPEIVIVAKNHSRQDEDVEMVYEVLQELFISSCSFSVSCIVYLKIHHRINNLPETQNVSATEVASEDEEAASWVMNWSADSSRQVESMFYRISATFVATVTPLIVTQTVVLLLNIGGAGRDSETLLPVGQKNAILLMQMVQATAFVVTPIVILVHSEPTLGMKRSEASAEAS